MTYQPLVFLNGLLLLTYGLGLLAVPTMFAGIDHYQLDNAGAAFARIWGGATVGLALMCFSARDFEWTKARRAVTFCLFIANGALFAVFLYNQLCTGIPNMLGWGHITLHLLFAINSLGVFYLLWRQY
jgi:hypothetical protein